MSEHIISCEDFELLQENPDCFDAKKFARYYELVHEPMQEVIRCRDCRKSDPEAYDYCEFYYANGRNPDGFCAWAERRES